MTKKIIGGLTSLLAAGLIAGTLVMPNNALAWPNYIDWMESHKVNNDYYCDENSNRRSKVSNSLSVYGKVDKRVVNSDDSISYTLKGVMNFPKLDLNITKNGLFEAILVDLRNNKYLVSGVFSKDFQGEVLGNPNISSVFIEWKNRDRLDITKTFYDDYKKEAVAIINSAALVKAKEETCMNYK